jgi:hypothetical protein
MASAIVAAPADLAWLAERHIVVGSRVGSCVKPHYCFGTVVAIRSASAIVVAWDDATTETVSWSAISPLGYTVEVPPLAASASVWASATAHLDNRVTFIRIDGERFAVVTSSNSGKVYRLPADASECPCIWNTQTRTMCSHMLCVELDAMMDELGAPAPTFPPCRCCGALTDGPRRLCDDCAASRARRLDRAAKRQPVAA